LLNEPVQGPPRFLVAMGPVRRYGERERHRSFQSIWDGWARTGCGASGHVSCIGGTRHRVSWRSTANKGGKSGDHRVSGMSRQGSSDSSGKTCPSSCRVLLLLMRVRSRRQYLS